MFFARLLREALEAYKAMLEGYTSKVWNRRATIILMEKRFTFEIKPNSTTYQFAGTIDQVIGVDAGFLARDFPLFHNYDNPTIILHRDIKSGARKGTNTLEMLLNDQLSIYAYALKYGTFDSQGEFDLVPDYHALYFLGDHIPYKKPPKGKTKDSPRGPGMYFIERPLARLKNIPQELMPTCASIRRGDFPREGASRQICSNHCSVRQYCEADLLQEIA